MAKFLVVAGQSNSGPLLGWTAWAALHPRMNTENVPNELTYGVTKDEFLMPGSWPAPWNVALNMKGLALNHLRYFTYYHPLATGYRQYPHVGTVTSSGTAVSTSSRIYVTQKFPVLATAGFGIINRKTGVTHAINSTDQTAPLGTGQSALNITGGGAGFSEKSATVTISVPATPGKVTWARHGFAANTVVDFRTTGTLPDGISPNVPYYVRNPTANDFEVSLTSGGASINTGPGAGSGTHTGNKSPVAGEEFDYEVRVVGAPAGNDVVLSIHFTSSLNTAGTIVGLKLASGTTITNITAWNDTTRTATLASSAGFADLGKVVICPRSVSAVDTTIAQSKAAFAIWGYWLPLCFYGRTAGGTYGRISPFPPGFDYPTFFPSMPYDQSFSPSDPVFGLASAIHLGVAEAMSEYYGDTVYVTKTNFGGSALARTVGALAFPPSGWFDPGQYTYWAPGGKSNTCYGRWSEEMQHAVSGLPVGVTLDLIGIIFIQGEADSGDEHGVRQYWDNLRALKAAMRARLKALGVWTKDAAKIPWIHPKLHANAGSVQERWNDQLSLATIEDPYMRTFEVQDIPVDIETHYMGAGQTTMEYRFRDAFFELFATTDTSGEIDICNLALAHIGDSAKITSLDPLDGSAQATHCARFYPIARDALLETRQWSFALKRSTLQALLAEDSDATEWGYAYMHPNDVLSILSVQPDDATDDYVQPSLPVGFPVSTISQGTSSFSNVSAPYSVEVDSRGRKVIYTDLDNASIRYVAKVTDTRRYPQTFRLALSWKLASMLAGPIIKGEAGAAESKRCLAMMMAHLGPAESKDAQQSKADVPHIPPWIAARG